MLKTIITAKRIIPVVNFPSKKLFPIITEHIIEGVLATAVISINFTGFISVSADIYVRKSFGVPGIRNNMKIIAESFFSFFRIR